MAKKVARREAQQAKGIMRLALAGRPCLALVLAVAALAVAAPVARLSEQGLVVTGLRRLRKHPPAVIHAKRRRQLLVQLLLSAG